MLRKAAMLCLLPVHLVAAACTAKMLDQVNASLYWVVAYPDAGSSAGAGLPILNTYVTPKYTQAACDAHWTGTITVRLTISESGVPGSVSLTNDPGFGMGESVNHTVLNWRFAPATRDGRPVQSSSIAEFGFGSRNGHLAAPSPVLTYEAALPAKKLSKKQTRQVILRVVVDERGLPGNVVVARGIGTEWDEAAVASVRNWRFSPGTLDGRPIPAETTVAVAF